MIGQIGQGIDDTQRFNRFQIRRLFNFRSREVSHFMHTQFWKSKRHEVNNN